MNFHTLPAVGVTGVSPGQGSRCGGNELPSDQGSERGALAPYRFALDGPCQPLLLNSARQVHVVSSPCTTPARATYQIRPVDVDATYQIRSLVDDATNQIRPSVASATHQICGFWLQSFY